MEKITTNDGKIVEAYSKAELDAQATQAADKAAEEAIAKYKEENPDKTEELTQKEEELKLKEEELSKLKEKDTNFAKLREQKDGAQAMAEAKAEEKIEEFEKTMEKKLEESAEATEKKVLEGVYKDHYEETVKGLAGEDEELKKRIELEYKRLSDPTTNKAEISKKLSDAWTLATKTDEDQNVLNASIISSGGVAKPQVITSDNKFSQEEKSMARKIASAGGMKLDDADFEKYGQ